MSDLSTLGLASNSSKGKAWLSRIVRLIYPPLCVACRVETENERGLCPECWASAFFVSGAACDCCGVPLPGFEAADDLICEACMRTPPPWGKGRASVLYEGAGRRLVLSLKHGDRLDIAKTAGRWMVDSGAGLIAGDPLLVPVPLHWTRLLKRKYNQAAILADDVARRTGLDHCPDLLIRTKRTIMQKGMSRADRFENQLVAIRPNRKRQAEAKGRSVLLIDDVLTTGATLTACTQACFEAGAASVNILVLARVANVD